MINIFNKFMSSDKKKFKYLKLKMLLFINFIYKNK